MQNMKYILTGKNLEFQFFYEKKPYLFSSEIGWESLHFIWSIEFMMPFGFNFKLLMYYCKGFVCGSSVDELLAGFLEIGFLTLAPDLLGCQR